VRYRYWSAAMFYIELLAIVFWALLFFLSNGIIDRQQLKDVKLLVSATDLFAAVCSLFFIYEHVFKHTPLPLEPQHIEEEVTRRLSDRFSQQILPIRKSNAAERVWSKVRDTTSPAVLQEFIRLYGETPYGSIARARLDEITKPKPIENIPPVIPSVQQCPAVDMTDGKLAGTIVLPAQVPWFDSGISVLAGDKVAISASGRVYIGNVAAGQPNLSNFQTPEGAINTTAAAQGQNHPFIAPALVPWSLIGKIGSTGIPFYVGTNKSFAAPNSGKLYLSVNDNVFGDNFGCWNISFQLDRANAL
jgi:hypothetical protein